MFWFIVGFISGIVFLGTLISIYIFFQISKSLEEVHKDGWENPY